MAKASEKVFTVSFEGQSYTNLCVAPAGKPNAPMVLIFPDVKGECYCDSGPTFYAEEAREIASMGYAGVLVNPYSEQEFPQKERDASEAAFGKGWTCMNSYLLQPKKQRALLQAHLDQCKAQLAGNVDPANLACG